MSAFLKPPRVPRAVPVHVVHIRSTRTNAGVAHGVHAWIVNDHDGRLVEIISGDSSTESRLWARWPWFGTQQTGWFELGQRQAWPTTINVSPGEFRRIVGWEPWAESSVKLRAMADRCERYSAVREALNDVRVNGTGVHRLDHRLDGPRTATIYHRTLAHGGDHVSEHLCAAMAELVELGIVERVSDPNAVMPNGKTRQGDVVGEYRATDKTPAYA